MRKTLLASTILSLVLLMAVSQTWAAQSENITITVAVTPSLSVNLSSHSIELGSVAIGSTTESDTPIVVTNNGSGVAEVLTLSHSSAGDWTSGTTPGDETYVLNAGFAETVTGATFAHVDSVVSDNVAYNSSENLWFQFKAPSSTVSNTEQSITVTVTAQLP